VKGLLQSPLASFAAFAVPLALLLLPDAARARAGNSRACALDPRLGCAYETTHPRFRFERDSQAGSWRLTYRFRGSAEAMSEAVCRIGRPQAVRLQNAYGYRKDQLEPRIARRLQESVAREAFAAGKLIYGTVSPAPGEKLYRPLWSRKLAGGPVEEAMAVREEAEFYRWYDGHGGALRERAITEMKQASGFTKDPPFDWIPDYGRQIEASRPLMADCIAAIQGGTGSSPERLQAFFQSMSFRREEMEDDSGKTTGGFLLPPWVLIGGEGDCDSKAAAFCAIQGKTTPGLVILRSHGPGIRHALVGREADRNFSRPVRIGNRYFVPYEVAQPTAQEQVDPADYESGYVPIDLTARRRK
jgi:hypothetical protein